MTMNRPSYLNRSRSFMLLILIILIMLIMPMNVIAETTREDAVNAIRYAQQDIYDMESSGLSVNAVQDILFAANQTLERADFADFLKQNGTGPLADTARHALEGLNYEGFSYADVINQTDQIRARKETAYMLSDILDSLESKIERYKSQGVNVTKAESIFEAAKTSFLNERYGETETYTSEANSELDLRKSEMTALNVLLESGRTFIERYWKGVIFLLILFAVLGYVLFLHLNMRRLKSRLVHLKSEEKALIRLKKKNQTDLFENNSIPKSVYEIRAKKYTEKLNEVIADIPVVESMIRRRQKPHSLKKIAGNWWNSLSIRWKSLKLPGRIKRFQALLYTKHFKTSGKPSVKPAVKHPVKPVVKHPVKLSVKPSLQLHADNSVKTFLKKKLSRTGRLLKPIYHSFSRFCRETFADFREIGYFIVKSIWDAAVYIFCSIRFKIWWVRVHRGSLCSKLLAKKARSSKFAHKTRARISFAHVKQVFHFRRWWNRICSWSASLKKGLLKSYSHVRRERKRKKHEKLVRLKQANKASAQRVVVLKALYASRARSFSALLISAWKKSLLFIKKLYVKAKRSMSSFLIVSLAVLKHVLKSLVLFARLLSRKIKDLSVRSFEWAKESIARPPRKSSK